MIVSALNKLLFIINFGVKFIEIFDHVFRLEWKLRLNIVRFLLSDFLIEFIPFVVHILPFVFVLFD